MTKLLRTAFVAVLLLAAACGIAPAQQPKAPPIGTPQVLSCGMVTNACGSAFFTRQALQASTILNGTADPTPSIGAPNDYYFKTSTGQWWKKNGGTWAILASLVGPTGPTGATGATGANGSTWTHNTGAPSGGLGVNGDFYYRDDTSQVYFKAAGSWSVVSTFVSIAGNNVFTGYQTWKGFSETYSAPAITSGTLTIDLTQGTFFNVSSNANLTTFTITNAPAGKASSFTAIFTGNGTGYTQSWGSVKWPGGIAPILTTTSGKSDWLTFITNDGGSNWYGFIAGQSF